MSELDVRRYPVGIQTFEDIRREGYVYVDKTEFIWRLAHENGKSFFLSRPRRFGKTLLVSTMKAYFEGRLDLFEGLAVERLEEDWAQSPVLRIDLSMVKTRDIDVLHSHLNVLLAGFERDYGLESPLDTPGFRLARLIECAHEQTGEKVVVLVDEYDAPLLNVTDDPSLLESFREVMREFYMPLKACDEYLRFVFLTGITKFTQLSVFSELNNLTSISLDPRYAGICGITEEELLSAMGEDIGRLADNLGTKPEEALSRLKAHYDGYRFCDPSPDVYNPFSLLSAFSKGGIESFWFGSGTPTFLIRLMRVNRMELPDLEACIVRESAFDAPADKPVSPIPLLYQAGYLTIMSYDQRSRSYTLGIPNEVARNALRAMGEW